MTAALRFQALGHTGVSLPVGAPTNFTFDATNDGVAFVFMSETTDPITKVFFRYGVRVGTGTPPTFRISLQALDTSGNPTGTVLGGGSPASATFTPPADATWDGTGRWITLANSYTPTRGQILAIVIEHSSGTIDAANGSTITRSMLGGIQSNSGIPYALTENSGIWSKVNASAVFGYGTATTKYGMPITGQYNTLLSTVGNRSTMFFTIPTGFMSTYQLRGMLIAARFPATANTTKLAIWNSAGTQIATTDTIDSDHQGAISNYVNTVAIFNSLVTLDAGTKYYAGIEVLSGSTQGVTGVTVTENTDRQCFPLGENRGLATWNGSAWTETDTVLPLVELIFEDITVPSGSGGMVITGE